jgi:phosphoglycolate phosphatase
MSGLESANREAAPDAVRLIVFDWDGTLMDSETQIVHSMFGAIADMQLEPRSADQCRNIIGLGLHEAIDTLYPGRNPDFAVRFVERYRHHWFNVSQESDLFPGARETLELLSEAGFLLAIATGKGRVGLDKVLGHSGMEQLFASTRCADETRSKPHPQMLQEILTELGVDAHASLMVGDTEYDMGMAREAGVHPVAVSYGVHERQRLMQHRPLVCLDTITELVDWLAECGLLNTDSLSKSPLAATD